MEEAGGGFLVRADSVDENTRAPPCCANSLGDANHPATRLIKELPMGVIKFPIPYLDMRNSMDNHDWFDNTVVLWTLIGLVGIPVTGSLIPLLTTTIALMGLRMAIPKL